MNQHILSATPPMGWNSWNTFFKHPNEELVCQIADAFVQEGLLEAGYKYLIIDDGWAMRERDKRVSWFLTRRLFQTAFSR